MTVCVLPGCINPVSEAGAACPDCIAAFGPMLQTGGRRLAQADIDARDREVRRQYATQQAVTG